MVSVRKCLIYIFLIFTFAAYTQFAYGAGSISGVVSDSTSLNPLVGANIVLEGTALGAATDDDGYFLIQNVAEGTYQLTVHYIGYKTKTISVSVQPDQMSRYKIMMQFQALEGEEVMVTALLEGQAGAINQQINANTIVNVVSADKIKALPDQNAAESISRLPAVSTVRDAGEGQKVVVRGLSPRYNSITINGERIPATGGVDILVSDEELTGGGENRSVDLSMISPDVLAGIEVFKALTPDMDADAIGGTVNLTVREAREKLRGDFRFQYGYSDHVQEFGQFKGSFNLSNRYFNNKLGVIATGSIQQADRSSDALDGNYSFVGVDQQGDALIEVNNLNLVYRLETRDRYSASIAFDYNFPNGGILWSNFWGRTDRDQVRRRRRYRLGTFRQEYDMRDLQLTTRVLSSILSGQHKFKLFEFNWRGSYSNTKQNTPFSHTARFRELAAFDTVVVDQGPAAIPPTAKNRLENTFYKESRLDYSDLNERDFTAQIDLKLPLTFGSNISAYIKTGAKYKDKRRTRDNSRLWTESFGVNDIGEGIALGTIPSYRQFNLDSQNRILINNFIDPTINADNFLDGEYEFGIGLDRQGLNKFQEYFHSRFANDPNIDLEDYNAGEKIVAGYLMMQFDFFRKFILLPGFRYEKTFNDYVSVFGNPINDDELDPDDPARRVFADTTGTRDYGEFLPMIHLRYKFTPWGDLRFAATKTLSRPDYFSLVPWQRIDFFSSTVQRGNPNLKHTIAWNYDAYLSLYNNMGLLTFGVFYKELDNVDFIRSSRIVDPTSSTNGFELTVAENAPNTSTLKGFEIELQTNLSFLPSPFSGIVLGGNYARIHSKTEYPFLVVRTNPDPPFNAIFTDTVRSGRMPNQSDFIANFTIGYERGSFTGRLSMIYQGKSLQTIGIRNEVDGFTDDFVRWDLNIQQGVWKNLSIFLNTNNFTNRPEREFLGTNLLPTTKEIFGWSTDLGLRYWF